MTWPSPEDDEYQRGWLVQRLISDPTDIAHYFIHAPHEASLDWVIQIAGRRWTIEECFQQAKQLTEGDEYDVRPFAAGITVPAPILPTLKPYCRSRHGVNITNSSPGNATTKLASRRPRMWNCSTSDRLDVCGAIKIIKRLVTCSGEFDIIEFDESHLLRPECGPEEAATQYHVLGNWNFENVVSGIEGLDEAVASDL